MVINVSSQQVRKRNVHAYVVAAIPAKRIYRSGGQSSCNGGVPERLGDVLNGCRLSRDEVVTTFRDSKKAKRVESEVSGGLWTWRRLLTTVRRASRERPPARLALHPRGPLESATR